MASQAVTDLVKRFKNDEYDEALPYLKILIEDGNLTTPASKGSALQAIDNGLFSLSDAQLNAIALEMINQEVYLEKCPNEWCGNTIEWEDMNIAVWENQCCHCKIDKEKHDKS